MYKKYLILVATALVVMGCHNSSGVKKELVTVPVSLGSVDSIVVDANGLTKEVKGSLAGVNDKNETVITASYTIAKGQELRNAQGQSACPAANPCKITAEQKACNNISACEEAEWKRLIGDVVLPTNHIALYSGTLDITEANRVLTNCGMTVTINVPETAYWPDSPRWDKIHGIGCVKMQVWVTTSCDSTEGKWVEAQIVQTCDNGGGKQITINVDYLPAHIVMFVTMDKDHPNITNTGGS